MQNLRRDTHRLSVQSCFTAFLWALIYLLLTGGCTKTANPDDTSFHFYLRARVAGLDPISTNDTYSHRVVSQIYEGLLSYHYLKRPIELVPVLAESLPEISKDGLTYTFKIKKGVHFHDHPVFPGGKGRELVAQDFIYSWRRLADPRNRSKNYWVFKNRIQGLDQWRKNISAGTVDYTTPIQGLQAPDSHTLIIKLIKPYYQLLHVLTMGMSAVTPKEVIEYYGKEFDNHAIGTGPYILKEWIRGSQLTLTKNPNYHPMYYPTEGTEEDKALGFLEDAGKRVPFLDKITVHEIPKEQPQYLMFLKGDIDMFIATKDYIPRFVQDLKIAPEHKDSGMRLQLYAADDITYMLFNMDDPVLKNKKLRQAMSMAYDQKTAIRLLYAGFGYDAHGPIPPSLDGYVGAQKNLYKTNDKEKAKRLLAQAGYPGGKGLPTITYDMATTSSATRQIGDFFKQQMAQIGVKIKLIPNTWPQYNQKVKKRQVQLASAAWNADYPDAENFLQLFYGPNSSPGPNSANYNNPRYDALYEKAALLPPSPERTKIYRQMQNILMDEVPWIFHIHRMRVILIRDWLKNYKHSWAIYDTMKYYRVDGPLRAKRQKDL